MWDVQLVKCDVRCTKCIADLIETQEKTISRWTEWSVLVVFQCSFHAILPDILQGRWKNHQKILKQLYSYWCWNFTRLIGWCWKQRPWWRSNVGGWLSMNSRRTVAVETYANPRDSVVSACNFAVFHILSVVFHQSAQFFSPRTWSVILDHAPATSLCPDVTAKVIIFRWFRAILHPKHSTMLYIRVQLCTYPGEIPISWTSNLGVMDDLWM